MNVYDVDGTVYPGDCSVEFWLYCLCRHPWVLCFVPLQLLGILSYKLGVCSKTRMKERFFSFLRAVPNAEEAAERFWRSRIQRVENWYLSQQAKNDVFISASPEFLLRPLCRAIGVRHLIASRVNPSSGTFDGENCYGCQKVQRFQQEFGEAAVQEFYSDSRSDEPMARLAQVAYWRRHEQNCAW